MGLTMLFVGFEHLPIILIGKKLSNEDVMISCYSSELHFAFFTCKISCTKNEMPTLGRILVFEMPPYGISCIVSTPPPPTTLRISSKAFLHVGFSSLCCVRFSGLQRLFHM